MASQVDPVVLEDVQLIFRNFAGKEGPFNAEGDRNFGVILTDDQAKGMAEDGWNVKTLNAREDAEDDTPTPWLPVAVGYKIRPPKIVLVTSRGQTKMTEAEVETLDWVDITNVDLIVRPYEYTVQGRSGIKAYVQSLYITIEEDPLEKKYGGMDTQGGEPPELS